MSVSDMDIEALEAHLDGELSSLQEAALLARLAKEPELAIELAALRGDRALRAGVFESFEPDDSTVARLVADVRKQITKDAVRTDRMRIFRYIASAAACILFSFSAGWLGKARVTNPGPADVPSQMVAQNREAGSIDFSGEFGGSQGVGSLVSNTLGSQNPNRPIGNRPTGNLGSGAYRVALTDNLGRVVAMQSFDTLQEAQEFRDDVGRWQNQQQQQQQAPVAEPVVYKDRF